MTETNKSDSIIIELRAVEARATRTLNDYTMGKLDEQEGVADAIRVYQQLRATHDAVKKLSAAYGTLVNTWNNYTIPEKLEEAGVKTITVEGVGRVTVGNRVSASILDKGIGMEWLTNNGYGDIVTETVNASTLGAFAKSLIEEGKDLPDDIFKVTISKTTSLTKIK